MSGLVLKLAPKERVLINGAVIENGERRTRLTIVTPQANVLRLKDAIHPDEAKTPVTRVCYIAQLVLSGDSDPASADPQILSGIAQLERVFRDGEGRRTLAEARDAVGAGQHYQALKAMRRLIAAEARLIGAAGA